MRSRVRRVVSIGLAVAAAASLATAAEAPVLLRLDPAASQVGFLLDTTWHQVEGVSKAVTGEVTGDAGHLFLHARVSVTIQADTLETGIAARDRKMRESCLETARHPTITFVSTADPVMVSSSPDPAGGYREVSMSLPGDLTIHGVTRPVALPATARRAGDGWTVSGKLIVKLSDYAIPDPSIFLNRVHDDVTVTFDVTLKRPQGS